MSTLQNKNGMDAAFLVLRIAVGAIFVAHGAQKLFGIFGGGGMDAFSGFVGSLGFAPAFLWAWAAALSEFVCGICLILGVLPRISAAMLSIVMLAAIAKVHAPNGFFAANGGFEFQMLILAACVSLILTGSGKLSVFNKL